MMYTIINYLNLLRIVVFCLISFSIFSNSLDALGEAEKEDIKEFTSIRGRTNNDPLAYDEKYGNIGDRLIDFASAHKNNLQQKNILNKNQEQNYQKVLTLYEEDKAAGKLNGLRLTWLGIQLSMALSDEQTDKIVTGITSVINQLSQVHNEPPFWLIKFSELEAVGKSRKFSFFNTLKTCHSFFQPIAIYSGTGRHSLEDYFVLTKEGFFPYGLDFETGKGHIVHGNLFRNAAEKTLHDMGHFYDPWLLHKGREDQKKEYLKSASADREGQKKEYLKSASAWKSLASKIGDLLDNQRVLFYQVMKRSSSKS